MRVTADVDLVRTPQFREVTYLRVLRPQLMSFTRVTKFLSFQEKFEQSRSFREYERYHTDVVRTPQANSVK